VSFNDAGDSVRSGVIDKVIDVFVNSEIQSELSARDEVYKSSLKYPVFIKSVLNSFNVQMQKAEVKGILLGNFVDIKKKIEVIRSRRNKRSSARQKKKNIVRPSNKQTIQVTTANGVKDLEYDICNVVFSGTINSAIDIQDFMDNNPDAVYNPVKFPGIVIKIEDPPSSILLFKTGRFVSVGLRNIKGIEAIKKDLFDRISRSGVTIVQKNIEADVKNIVLTTLLPDQSDKLVDLNMLGLLLSSCMYEPEVFPGLIYKLRAHPDGTGEQRAVFLVFSSKKVVCVGIRDIDDIPSILTQFVESIEELGDDVYIEKFSNRTIPDELRFLDLSD